MEGSVGDVGDGVEGGEEVAGGLYQEAYQGEEKGGLEEASVPEELGADEEEEEAQEGGGDAGRGGLGGSRQG